MPFSFCLEEFHLFYFLIVTGSEQIWSWGLEYRMSMKRPKPVGGGEGKHEWEEGEVQCDAGMTASADTRCSLGAKTAKRWAFNSSSCSGVAWGPPWSSSFFCTELTWEGADSSACHWGCVSFTEWGLDWASSCPLCKFQHAAPSA